MVDTGGLGRQPARKFDDCLQSGQVREARQARRLLREASSMRTGAYSREIGNPALQQWYPGARRYLRQRLGRSQHRGVGQFRKRRNDQPVGGGLSRICERSGTQG